MLWKYLKGAKVIVPDVENEVFIVWFGGSTFEVYTNGGNIIALWTTMNRFNLEEAIAYMEEKIAEGRYLEDYAV